MALQPLYPIRGLVYVGAGHGDQLESLSVCPVPNLIAIEADKHAHARLADRTAKHKNWKALQVVVSESNEEVEFYRYFNGHENGLLSPDELKPIWKNLRLREFLRLPASSLATILSYEEFRHDYNWLMLECLPAATILKGLGALIDGFDVIQARVTLENDDLGKVGASLGECDEFLMHQGFQKLLIEEENNAKLGQVFYLRDWKQLISAQKAEIEKTSDREKSDLKNKLEKEKFSLEETAAVEKLTLEKIYKKEKVTLEKKLEEAKLAFEKEKLSSEHLLQKEKMESKQKCENEKSSLEQAIKEEQKMREALQSEISVLEVEIKKQVDSNRNFSLQVEELKDSLDKVKEDNIRINEEVSELRTKNKSLSVKTNDFEFGNERIQGIVDELGMLRRSVGRSIKNETANAARQIGNFINLKEYLSTGVRDNVGLEINGWPASSDFLFYVSRLIEINKYKLIVEFGSGTSTLVIARTVENIKVRSDSRYSPKFLSFEHLEKYFLITDRFLRDSALRGGVDLVHAPLVKYNLSENDYLFYDCTQALSENKVEFSSDDCTLILVDGPPEATNAEARYPAVNFALNSIDSNEIHMLLDDAARNDETKILEKWKSDFTQAGYAVSEEVINLEKGASLLKAKKHKFDVI